MTRIAFDGLEQLLASGLGEVSKSAVIEVARARPPQAGLPA